MTGITSITDLLDEIFKDTLLQAGDNPSKIVKKIILKECEHYSNTLEILTNHSLDHAEVYKEIKINHDRLLKLKEQIENGTADEQLTYAEETIQVNSIRALL